jgi:hypothetical protein
MDSGLALRASRNEGCKLDSIRHERGVLVFVIEERTKRVTSRVSPRFIARWSRLVLMSGSISLAT